MATYGTWGWLVHGTDPGIHTLDVLWLHDPRARRPELVGAKAANLAEAHHLGLPALPGFVIPTTAVVGPAGRTAASLGPLLEGLRADWARLSADGTRPLVVRSSSVGEDTGASSMAGRRTAPARGSATRTDDSP